MKPVKADRDEMTDVLSATFDTTEQAAKAAIDAAFEIYEKRQHFGLIYKEGSVYMVRGGFSTPTAPVQWAEKNGQKPGTAVVVPLYLSEEQSD